MSDRLSELKSKLTHGKMILSEEETMSRIKSAISSLEKIKETLTPPPAVSEAMEALSLTVLYDMNDMNGSWSVAEAYYRMNFVYLNVNLGNANPKECIGHWKISYGKLRHNKIIVVGMAKSIVDRKQRFRVFEWIEFDNESEGYWMDVATATILQTVEIQNEMIERSAFGSIDPQDLHSEVKSAYLVPSNDYMGSLIWYELHDGNKKNNQSNE
jgi:hypothetical protein